MSSDKLEGSMASSFPSPGLSPGSSHGSSRRAFLRAAITLPAGALLAACIAPVAAPDTNADAVPTAAPEEAAVLEPTPACGDDDDEPTIAQTEGPYYTPNTPQRTSLLEEGVVGRNLLLTGFVLTPDCAPIARALIDFWHCDDAGVYDNVGYRLRGHQFSDDQGQYQLTTIVPGIYPGRTRHIHVKVQAPNQPVLTTQLYFPNEAQNERDGIFHPSLLVDASEGAEGMDARFNFVLVV